VRVTGQMPTGGSAGHDQGDGPASERETAAQETAAQDNAPSYYGLQVLPPLTAVAELVAIVGIILTVDWLWPSLDINNVVPSVYWLPVLLLSLQYGTASGTLAVLVAIAAYFTFATMPEQGVGENEFAYRLRILAQPIGWIASAVLLGQFRMIQISAKRELQRRVDELEIQRQTLADHANALRSRCDRLEREIAARPGQRGTGLMEALGALRSAPTGQAAATGCLAAAFPGASVSLFVRQGASLHCAAHTGWATGADWPAIIAPDQALYQAIAGDRTGVCVVNARDDLALRGQGLAAVPIVTARSQRVIGMIKIERADASMISSELLAQLDVLAAIIEPLLEDTGSSVSFVRRAGEPAAAVPLRVPALAGQAHREGTRLRGWMDWPGN
jgi:polysaccharide biosynthesis protein PelD